MKPRKIVVKKPNGNIHYVRLELDKNTDLTPFYLISLQYANCEFKVDELETYNKVWFYFK